MGIKLYIETEGGVVTNTYALADNESGVLPDLEVVVLDHDEMEHEAIEKIIEEASCIY